MPDLPERCKLVAVICNVVVCHCGVATELDARYVIGQCSLVLSVKAAQVHLLPVVPDVSLKAASPGSTCQAVSLGNAGQMATVD